MALFTLKKCLRAKFLGMEDSVKKSYFSLTKNFHFNLLVTQILFSDRVAVFLNLRKWYQNRTHYIPRS